MRIQRALARAGVASRRHSEALISAGRVTVNGRVAQLGESIDTARDELRVDGNIVKTPVGGGPVWLALLKPASVMTKRADPRGRKTVFDLVGDVPGLTYVGRLDFMTEGLLLFTTDGAAVHALTHPSKEVERTYVAIVRGDAPAAALQARKGVELEDGLVQPRRVAARALRDGSYEFEVTITEGRKHEVRRLCSALGLRVDRLIRVSFGPITLGDLPVGASRPLTEKELVQLSAVLNLKGSGVAGASQ